MKKSLLLLMVLGLVAASVATAEAAKKPKSSDPVERTVEATYGPYPAPVTGCNELLGSWACAVVTTRAIETSFTATVTDAHGQPVFVEVSGDGRHLGSFCGETTEPISFWGGTTLQFHVGLNNWSVSADCPANRIKTTGTISVTLSNEVQPEPVRSGSILSGTGWFLDNERGGCQMSPECAAWLHNDCTGRLLGWHEGFTASIVDVDELADGPPTERVFRFGSGEPWAPVYGGVQLQFWSADCVEIPEAKWRSTDCNGDGSGRNCSSLRFRIPTSARWMTVTGYQDNVHIAWTLT